MAQPQEIPVVVEAVLASDASRFGETVLAFDGAEHPIEAGDYMLFWANKAGKVRFERFTAVAGKEGRGSNSARVPTECSNPIPTRTHCSTWSSSWLLRQSARRQWPVRSTAATFSKRDADREQDPYRYHPALARL